MYFFFNLLFVFILSNHLKAFDGYNIFFFGIPIIDVKIEDENNKLTFLAKSNYFFNNIWPVNNSYYTQYDSISYAVKNYSKSIHQGNYQGKLNCEYIQIKSILECNGKEITVNDSIQNIFTLLAQLSYKSSDYLDSKWFQMNHEGMNYKGRFLFIGNEEVEVENIKILCDHYKLDIINLNSNISQLSPWDYFTDNIVSQEALRELWVESNPSNKKKIIKASVSLYGIVMTAEINNY